MRDTKIIDLALACDMLMLDECTVKNLLAKFADVLPGMVVQMQNAADSNDLALLNSIGHKLKGTAANFRLEKLRQIGEALENVKNLAIDTQKLLFELDECVRVFRGEVDSICSAS